MAYNKVTFGGNTLIDLTSDTVTANSLLEGVIAHGADGVVITGALLEGDLLEYGDKTTSMVGAGQVDYMIVGPDTIIGVARVGERLA